MPGKGTDLEAFREMFDNGKLWAAIGKIIQLELAEDRSVWRAKVSLFPDGEEMIARMTWGQVGPNAGIFGPASVGDLVLIVIADAEQNHGFVVSRLSSREDQIPEQVGEGHTLIKALAGKKLYVGSDTAVLIGKNVFGNDPDEPLVLGTKNKTYQGDLIDGIKAITVLGNLGASTGNPLNAATFTALKASPIDDDKLTSDVAFTEKGD